MKKHISITIIILAFIACQSSNTFNKQSEQIKSKETKDDTETNSIIKKIEQNPLNGIWAENQNDNALFRISNDSLYYLEDIENPVSIEYNGGNFFVINGSVPVKCEIIKLNNDSLWYLDEFNEDTTKLYRR